MMARVCGGGGGPFLSYGAQDGPREERAQEPYCATYNRIKVSQRVGFLSGARKGGSTKKPKGEREIYADPLNTCGPKIS